MSYSENNIITTKCCDPLEGLGDEVAEHKYYRVENIVFAEPLEVVNTEEKSTEQTVSRGINKEEIIPLGHITIKKRPGKLKNVYITLHDVSNLCCPLDTCNKTFSSSAHLKAHIRKVHYAEKKFICEVCGAGFSAQYLLKRHSAVHGARKVQCPVCMKMLSVRTNLLVHLRSHADTRPHECLTCGGRFLRRATLLLHQKVHEKSPPFRTSAENGLADEMAD